MKLVRPALPNEMPGSIMEVQPISLCLCFPKTLLNVTASPRSFHFNEWRLEYFLLFCGLAVRFLRVPISAYIYIVVAARIEIFLSYRTKYQIDNMRYIAHNKADTYYMFTVHSISACPLLFFFFVISLAHRHTIDPLLHFASALTFFYHNTVQPVWLTM